MKKGPGYTLVVLGTMAFVTAGHAQGMSDQPADRPPVVGPQDENRTDSDVPDLSGTGESAPSGNGDAELPTAPGDDVSDLKGLPPAEGLPEAHSSDDTSSGSPASGAQAPPLPGY